MRTISLLYALLLGSFLITLSACEIYAPAVPSGPAIPGPNDPIIYSKHIQPIFNTSCSGSGCHFEKGLAGTMLDSWEHTMEGSEKHGAMVIPFSARKSHLFQHLNRDSSVAPVAYPPMPLGRDPLPIEQIRLIARWIDEGAKNDAGEIALAGENRPRAFATAQSEDLVSVIDLETRRVMRYIPVGAVEGGSPESPHNIILSPDRRFFYVNMIVGGTIEKYDTRSFAQFGTVRVGQAPAQIAITNDGSTLYVSNFSSTQRFINRVDAASMRVTDTIHDVGGGPHGVTLSRDEHYLYTTNAFGDDVTEIDLTTLEVTRRIQISPNNPLAPGAKPRYEPYQSELSADGTMLWVTCRASGDVRVIDLNAWRVVDSIAVGKTPLILKMTPDRTQLWVPNRNANSISVINTATRSVVATIPGIVSQPHAVAFTSDGATAFVTCENQDGNQHHPTSGNNLTPGLIYVIDVASRQVIRTVEVGAFAAGIDMSDER